jgi:hypothetical protein
MRMGWLHNYLTAAQPTHQHQLDSYLTAARLTCVHRLD